MNLLSKVSAILWVVLLYCPPAAAQHYECIKPGEQQYFTNGNGYVRGIRIDSTKTVGADTVYYPFKAYRSDGINGSWVGATCIKQADGTFLFSNTYRDTVVIRTQAQVGDTWIFYNDTGARYFVAMVTNIDTGSVLGIQDSIKTIGITAVTDTGNVPTDTLSYFELKISKSHGWAQIFDLYNFPYRSSSSSWIEYNDLYLTLVTTQPLISLPSAQPVSRFNSIFRRAAVHNPTLMELYDYAPDDAYNSEY